MNAINGLDKSFIFSPVIVSAVSHTEKLLPIVIKLYPNLLEFYFVSVICLLGR